MKNNFRGWQTVFNFTFRQAAKGAGFKLMTTLITLIIIGAFIVINIVVAKPDEKKVEVSPVKTVFVLDNSGLHPTNFKEMNPQFSEEQFKNIEFVPVTGQTREAAIKSATADSTETIAVIITANDTGYEIEAVVPEGSTIPKDQASTLLAPI